MQILLAALLLFSTQLTGQEKIWNGVFTNEQAVRGEEYYENNCARCHRDNLDDSTSPKLIGDFFIDRWREDNLASLYTHMRTRMPADAPGTLDDAHYVDILSYLLDANGFPSGSTELRANEIATILLVGRNGPQSLPSNTPVHVVGCMTEDHGSWNLMRATEPRRTRNPDETNPDELKASSSNPLGVQNFKLQALEDLRSGFQADAYRDRKVQVKGVLLKSGTGPMRINVTSFEAVASSCD